MTDNTVSGRSPVTLYNIYWDAYKYTGLGFTDWMHIGTVSQDLTNLSLLFDHVNLPNFISDLNIMYSIQAVNNVGVGPLSLALSVTTVERIWSQAYSWGGVVPVAGASIVL